MLDLPGGTYACSAWSVSRIGKLNTAMMASPRLIQQSVVLPDGFGAFVIESIKRCRHFA